jgi:predicted nucleic acid-binding protein
MAARGGRGAGSRLWAGHLRGGGRETPHRYVKPHAREVLWIRGKSPIPVTDARKVQDFFQHEWIVVRELDRATAEAAREVVWNNGVKPKDAIHVATALLVHGQAPLDQLDTFDGDLLRISETLGIPPLKIGQPEIPGKLF